MITDASPLFSAATATEAHACSYVEAHGSYYHADAIAEIVGYYWQFAPLVAIDPNKAFAQCIHETSEHYPTPHDPYRPLSSWWALRPRRNPAGIGVNGVAQATPPPFADMFRWAHDSQRQMYFHGFSFSSWEQSVRMHLGWLLLFGLPAHTGTALQQSLVAETLAFRQVPFLAGLRGTVACLRELGAAHNRYNIGKPPEKWEGWADPGFHYGAEIAAISQAISEVQVS